MRLRELKKHPVLSEVSFRGNASDKLTAFVGSWTFILASAIFIISWVSINVYGWINSWDPYPFILLNLFLSVLAAIQGPIILMSHHRENQKDRIRAEYDYSVNRKAEREIEKLRTEIEKLRKKLK